MLLQTAEVNYTSDGTYATYSDGAPVAVELRLNFMETKLIFADEVGWDINVLFTNTRHIIRY